MYLDQRGVMSVLLEGVRESSPQIVSRTCGNARGNPCVPCLLRRWRRRQLETCQVYRHGRLRDEVCNSFGGTKDRTIYVLGQVWSSVYKGARVSTHGVGDRWRTKHHRGGQALVGKGRHGT